MKTLFGGAIAFVVGLILIVVWIEQFLQLLAGAIPAILLLGGCLAIYLGFDELKDGLGKEDDAGDSGDVNGEKDKEIEKLKKEIDTLKKKKK